MQTPLKLVSAGNGAATAVAYNPIVQLYYDANGGASIYPIETFSNNGTALASPSAGADYRGLWWNSNTNKLEGNTFGSGGVYTQTLNGSGYPTSAATFSTGADMPDVQSVGTYDSAHNEIIYYNSGNIYKYNRSTNALDATVAITGLPVPYTNLNETSIGYTGKTGYEFVVYDYVNNALYFINASGAFTAMSQLPASAALTPNQDYGTSFSNKLFWLFDPFNIIWQSYSVDLAAPYVLPIGLTSFTASSVNNNIVISWSVTTQDNNTKMIVEKSINAKDFTPIQLVNSKGTGDNDYSYIDTSKAPSKIIYYRLKMVDADGSYTYSNIATVTNQPLTSSFAFYIYPNPAIAFTTVYFNGTISKATVNVFNAAGVKLISDEINNAATYKLNTQFLFAGLYYVEVITSTGDIYQQKFTR